MAEVLFVVQREADARGARWAYINSCPHGHDLGAIHLGPEQVGGEDWAKVTWKFTDLGNGRCRIEPSILAKGIHEGQDCHFGPGEFAFVWLEPGQLRNPETGLPDPNLWRTARGP